LGGAHKAWPVLGKGAGIAVASFGNVMCSAIRQRFSQFVKQVVLA